MIVSVSWNWVNLPLLWPSQLNHRLASTETTQGSRGGRGGGACTHWAETLVWLWRGRNEGANWRLSGSRGTQPLICAWGTMCHLEFSLEVVSGHKPAGPGGVWRKDEGKEEVELSRFSHVTNVVEQKIHSITRRTFEQSENEFEKKSLASPFQFCMQQ